MANLCYLIAQDNIQLPLSLPSHVFGIPTWVILVGLLLFLVYRVSKNNQHNGGHVDHHDHHDHNHHQHHQPVVVHSQPVRHDEDLTVRIDDFDKIYVTGPLVFNTDRNGRQVKVQVPDGVKLVIRKENAS
jgi:membrane protein implicated in regulation of membrane protease activity